ncbi:MAG: hypothetical protein IJ262_01415 [Clostridia bacterium]|nr:hypothetical protein [Clostridia bacterium]
MIKLFTLENLSAFSSDAVYKICLTLEKFGLSDEGIVSFDNYDSIFSATDFAMRSGDEIIIAVEPSDYNKIKRRFSEIFSLSEYSCPEIAQFIKEYSGENVVDFNAHCVIPTSCDCHISADGLYSGFTVKINEGSCTYLPLDFLRLDSILESLIKKSYAPASFDEETEKELEEEETDQLDDFVEPVSKMVYSLIQVDKSVAIATGEATMWIYNLYDRIDGLSDVMSFIQISDEEADDAVNSFEEENEADKKEQEAEEKPKESACSKTIRHAMEARNNAGSTFGAAISEVYSAEGEDGEMNYFAFVAVADDKTAKAKKINTNNEEEAALLLPHCVTVLSETVCQKVDAISVKAEEEKEEEEKVSKKTSENKKLSPGMIAFAAVILLIAIVSPIFIVFSLLGDDSGTTTAPNLPVFATDSVSTTAPPLVETTTQAQQLFPGITEATTLSNPLVDNNQYVAAEPTASEYSVSTTMPSVASSKGTFTFYVFGYGHGVGLSQHGANYLASQGWNYAQILANYYYGSTLVSGDTYPETIKYNGTPYKTRDYLAGVLEGEMGSSFLPEALKAQAVAIYTFAKYYGFEITTNQNTYKANPSSACYAAVDEVMKNGLYISHGGNTALTPFHSISAGITTSYYNVWGGTAVSYLGGGRPSYGDYNAKDFKTTYSISSDDLKAIVKASDLGIELAGDPATWITVLAHDKAVNDDIGYVSSISVGGKIISGYDFRTDVMEGRLRSHCFMIVYTPEAKQN